MSKNYMAGVAKLLGVELEEAFEVYIGGECQGRCRFTKDEVEILVNHCWYNAKAETLEWLLNGTATIVKLPWRPQTGELYFTPCIDEDESDMFTERHWNNDYGDMQFYKFGIVCKSQQEAIALTKKMLKLAEKTLAQEVEENG